MLCKSDYGKECAYTALVVGGATYRRFMTLEHYLEVSHRTYKDPRALGRLGGSVGWASNFGSGHDLAVREFEQIGRAHV